VDEEKPEDIICQPYLVKFIQPLEEEKDFFEPLEGEEV